MKNKLILRIAKIVIITFFIASMFYNFAFATGGNFDFAGFEDSADTSIKTPVTTFMGAIIGVMRIICTGIAIIMIIVLAIKYMSSAPGDRAEIKKSAVQYVVGAAVFFGAAGILTLIESAVKNVIGE